MATVTIYGASDDLIEIKGDIYEEFNPPYDADEPSYLAFSDGTVVSIIYGSEGIWRIVPVHKGTATYELTQATDVDDDYTDRLVLTGEIAWAVFGSRYEAAKG